jgi:hypothetical protein
LGIRAVVRAGAQSRPAVRCAARASESPKICCRAVKSKAVGRATSIALPPEASDALLRLSCWLRAGYAIGQGADPNEHTKTRAGDRGWQGHAGLELRNVDENYRLERSHRFARVQPNSGFGDYSPLSCGVADRLRGTLWSAPLGRDGSNHELEALALVQPLHGFLRATPSRIHASHNRYRTIRYGRNSADRLRIAERLRQ